MVGGVVEGMEFGKMVDRGQVQGSSAFGLATIVTASTMAGHGGPPLPHLFLPFLLNLLPAQGTQR